MLMKLNKSTKRYPLVVVEWDDANNVGIWQDNDDIDRWMKSKSWECKNVGWLIREEKDFYLLAGRISPNDEEQFGLLERLPKKLVKNIKYLEK